ncbi:MAG: hypothetical protein ABR910_10410 [Acidobacteriaceae bacterium]|jgi:hypothetical protein
MSSGVGKYRLGPFLLASELPFPELPALESAAPGPIPDSDAVSIRLAPVPTHIENVVANETRWFASREEYLLRVPGVANFLVRHGREVLVEPAPNSLPADIRAYLLSPIFSTLCHQAGMYSLHASSVRVGDGVVAFLGHSGAGKSTLAAFLDRRGYTVVSDDICLLDPRPRPGAPESAENPGHTLVVPVAPSLKLWRSALEQLGTTPETLPQVFSRDDKYRLPLHRSGSLDHPLPLRQLYFLEWAEPEDEGSLAFTPVEGVHAVSRLMEYTNYDYLMKATGRQTGNFLLCGRILAHARAFTLRRPRDFAHIDAALDALESHLHHHADG